MNDLAQVTQVRLSEYSIVSAPLLARVLDESPHLYEMWQHVVRLRLVLPAQACSAALQAEGAAAQHVAQR